MPDDDNPSTLDRTFAVMLTELEDAATTLTNRQNVLARQLAEVDAELDRVEAVRAAMVGQRKPLAPRQTRRHRASTEGRKETASQRRVDRIMTWAKARDGEFTGADVAAMLEVNVQGVGPVLAGMVRREELQVREDGHARRFYSVVAK